MREEEAAIQLFESWEALLRGVPRRTGQSAPTHYRYSRWGAQRHRWLDDGHYFPLHAPASASEFPSLHHGDFVVQLYHQFSETVKNKGGTRTYYMTPVPLRPSQPCTQLRVQFAGRVRRPKGCPSSPPVTLTRSQEQSLAAACDAVASGCACGTCTLLRTVRASPSFRALLWAWLQAPDPNEKAGACTDGG